ncbi:hypothetical protein [Pseudomonas sp. zfem005]|uniref:hypothetical protein n=1 Tax=Pseudomonas sp. zfem005 TaxID=3078200 RepID=UPI00292A0FF5|nr:hypothetical protein [Pseudomonas sp. zfem005]MDU9416762.1 hypothetical protein [Pseudomonas sp. zfem005]
MHERQRIYREMLRDSVIHARNRSTCGMLSRWSDKSERYELELVHNLYLVLDATEYENHDLYFLEQQAAWYVKNCPPSKSPLYRENCKRIRRLIELLPESQRGRLDELMHLIDARLER